MGVIFGLPGVPTTMWYKMHDEPWTYEVHGHGTSGERAEKHAHERLESSS
jgi:hypothetical protein